MAVPATQNLTITRGDTEVVVITINDNAGVPLNITGRTYRAQIRATKDSSVVSAAFVCVVTNAAAGEVTCTLTAGNASTLAVGKQYWDFEENYSGIITTILAGTVTVLADVSR